MRRGDEKGDGEEREGWKGKKEGEVNGRGIDRNGNFLFQALVGADLFH